MKIVLRNRIATVLGSNYDMTEFSNLFMFRAKNYWFSPAFKRRVWDGYIRPFNKIQRTLPTGLFIAKLREFRDMYPDCKIVDKRVNPEFHDFDQVVKENPAWTLHRAQDEACRIMIENSTTGGLILAATGTGKTRMAGAYFKTLKGTGLMLFDEISLMMQAKSALEKIIGEEVGVIGKSILKIRRINVGTSQTINLHLHDPEYEVLIKSLDTLIIDELHKQMNKRNFTSVRNMKPKAVFGLTATLHLKEDHLAYNAYMLCGKVLFEYPYEEALEDGVLSKGVVMGIDFNRDIYLLWKDAYDKYIVRGQQRNAYIVSLVQEAVKRNLTTLIMVERVTHLRILRKRLEEAGLIACEAWGQVKEKDRTKIVRLLNQGKINVVVANRVFKQGTDIPGLNVVIDAANYADWSDPLQKFGRGTRITKEKQSFIYIDIGDRKPPAGLNPFVKNTRARRKALASLGVEVVERLHTATPKEIFDQAERILVR